MKTKYKVELEVMIDTERTDPFILLEHLFKKYEYESKISRAKITDFKIKLIQQVSPEQVQDNI